jgi:hypothetical protein
MRFINIYWKTLLHILLLALEDPIGITSYRRKYRHPLSKFNGFLCSFDLFYLSDQIISMCISEHSPNGWRQSSHASCGALSPIIHAD